MRILKFIVKIILGCILTISLIGTIFIYEAEKTILNKNFVLDKLEKNNYYNNMYSALLESFNAYIGPSGLEEEILEGVISKENVKEDINNVIEKIYSFSDEEIIIDTNSIKERLNNNINDYLLQENLTVKDVTAIEDFEEKIIDEYTSNITYSKYLNYAKKVFAAKNIQLIETVRKLCILAIIVSILAILLINIKNMKKIPTEIVTFMLSCGIILQVTIIFTKIKTDIDNITILNTAFSITIRDIINTILNDTLKVGIAITISSVLIMIICNTVFYKNNKKQSF